VTLDGFQDRCLKPLSHSSVDGEDYSQPEMPCKVCRGASAGKIDNRVIVRSLFVQSRQKTTGYTVQPARKCVKMGKTSSRFPPLSLYFMLGYGMTRRVTGKDGCHHQRRWVIPFPYR
ncbi:hypothetical protein, partial [Edwardsiella tarda]